MVIKLLAILCLAYYLNAANAIQPARNQEKIYSHLGLLDNAELFDTIRENQKTANIAHETVKKHVDEIANIKAVLSNLLSKVNSLEKQSESYVTASTKESFGSISDHIPQVYTLKSYLDLIKRKVNEHDNVIKVQKWGPWTKWSTCSVTCGKGRKIRWRHCLRDCRDAETEMEEKTCQLPACKPGKLFGVIKL